MRILIVSALCALLLACSNTGLEPEDALRAWVEQMELAAEEKHRSAMLDKISEGYADARGNDYEDIGNMLRLYMLRHNNVAIASTIDSIEIQADTAAIVRLTVAMAGRNEGVLGFDADAYRFELELVRLDGDWLLIGARWGEIGRDLR